MSKQLVCITLSAVLFFSLSTRVHGDELESQTASIFRWPRIQGSNTQKELRRPPTRNWHRLGVNNSQKPAIPIYSERFDTNAAMENLGIASWLKTASIFSTEGLSSTLLRSRIQILVYSSAEAPKVERKTIGIAVPSRKNKAANQNEKITIEIPANLSPLEAKENFAKIEEVVAAIVLFDPSDKKSEQRLQKIFEGFDVDNCLDFDSKSCKKLIQTLTELDGGSADVHINQVCPDQKNILQLHSDIDAPISIFVSSDDPNAPIKKQKKIGAFTSGPLKENDLCDLPPTRKIGTYINKLYARYLESVGGDMYQVDPAKRNSWAKDLCSSRKENVIQMSQTIKKEIEELLLSVPPKTQILVKQIMGATGNVFYIAENTCGNGYTILTELANIYSAMKSTPTMIMNSCALIARKTKEVPNDLLAMSKKIIKNQMHRVSWSIKNGVTNEQRHLPDSSLLCGTDLAKRTTECTDQRDSIELYLEYFEREALIKETAGKSGCFIAEPDPDSTTNPPRIKIRKIEAADANSCAESK